MTYAARNFRSTMRTIADPVRNPALAPASFSWTAFNPSYPYTRVFFDPVAATLRFSGTNVVSTPAAECVMTYRGGNTETLVMERTIPILDSFHAIPPGGVLGKGWSFRVRTHPSGTLPKLLDAGGFEQPANAWYDWNQVYQIYNYRPSTTQLNTYCYLDFSRDGGATTAFTIEVNYLRSTSA